MKKWLTIIFLTSLLFCGFLPVFADPVEIGFSNYVSITIDADDIDEVLTDFPLLVHLNGSCGVNSFNASAIFTEIGNNYNSTGYSLENGTRLYFEVEYWNATEENAFVWVKIPEISNTTDTIFYLWFENGEDGSEYNSPSDIWSDNFVFVMHMNDYDTTTVLDSTSYNNDGTKLGINEPIETTGKIGKGQQFDGSDDCITVLNDSVFDLNASSYATFEIFIKPDALWTEDYGSIFERFTGGSGYLLCAVTNSTGIIHFEWDDIDGGDVLNLRDTNDRKGSDWLHYMMVIDVDGKSGEMWINGDLFTTDTCDTELNTFNTNLSIGGTPNYDGLIDEIRFSNVTRSETWITTSYNTQIDNLNIFGTITALNVPTLDDALTFGVLAFIIAIVALALIVSKL